MAWCALVRTWNGERKTYDSLTMRIEETPGPGCLIRLYDGDAVVAEELGASPQEARNRALQRARDLLQDNSITEDSLSWVQVP